MIRTFSSLKNFSKHTTRWRGGIVVATLALVGLAALTGVGSAQTDAAPTNTTEPQISGVVVFLAHLTATTGTWGGSPTSYLYQWMRCPVTGGASDASDCAAISSAQNRIYRLRHADVGQRIRVRVTAANADGSRTAVSNATVIVKASAGATAPANSRQPSISGAAVVGSILTATTGSWTGSPSSYHFQWMLCPSSGGAGDASDCAAIGGATTSRFVPGSADVGKRLRVRVTAANASGSKTVASNATAIVQATNTAAAPASTGQPQISGTTVVGSTLTATTGTWTGFPASYDYRWTRCPASGSAADASNCAAISGATTSAYVLGSADVGKRLRVRVTAANAHGSTTVASNATAIVKAAAPLPPPVVNGCAKRGGAVPVASVSSPARLTIDQTQISPSRISFGTRSITARFHVSACGGSVQGALVYVTAVPYGQFANANEQVTGPDGWATLQFNALNGFPVSNKQQLLVMFVRARKNGDNLLGGISTRRLVSFHVTHG